MFVITTDGQENASRKYHSKQIKEMIRSKEEEDGWEFLFLAANIDAVETADSIGIRKECAVNYVVEEETEAMFEIVSECVSDFICEKPTQFEKIEENIKKRKK